MLINRIEEPTCEQIAATALVAEDEHQVAHACWYPQMGGYVGKCVIIFDKQEDQQDGTCFTALVWHDGEFAFGADHGWPAVIHHCSAQQFISFGTLVTHLIEKQHAQVAQ